MQNNKKIILITILLLLTSSVCLSWTEDRQADLNLNKNWWALAFVNPKTKNLSFVIENHSNENNFQWKILGDAKNIVKEGDIAIAEGTTWTVDVQVSDLTEKAIVQVSSGSDKKEIYKIFNK